MSTVTIVLLVILAVLIVGLIVLYFLGKKAQKKRDEQEAQLAANAQTVSMLIIIPCAGGFPVLANPILHLLYPHAPDGALVFQLSAVTMILVAVNHTLQGSLFGLGRMYTPALALLTGAVVKIVLNLMLIINQKIGM